MPVDVGIDIFGPVNAQRLHNNDVGKDKGYLIVPTPIENPPILRIQYFREVAPHDTLRCGISDG